MLPEIQHTITGLVFAAPIPAIATRPLSLFAAPGGEFSWTTGTPRDMSKAALVARAWNSRLR